MGKRSNNSIAVVYTGGTLGGKPKQGTNRLDEDIKFDSFFDEFDECVSSIMQDAPEIIPVRSSIAEMSEEFSPDVAWREISNAVRRAAEHDCRGILVVHGTDTLAYTAAFLAFQCAHLNKPIVLVGSNKPLKVEETDAEQNIRDAVYFLTETIPTGVYVCFSGIKGKGSTIHAGVKTRKVKFKGNSFASINCSPLGKIEVVKSIFTGHNFVKRRFVIRNRALWDRMGHHQVPLGPVEAVTGKVAFFKTYPGFDPGLIEYAISRGAQGVVLELYNSGTACSKQKYSIIPTLKKCNSKGIPVFVTSQQRGEVTLGPYGSSQKVEKAGAIGLGVMTTECAIAKLTWILSNTTDVKTVRELMKTDMVGEHANGKDT